MGELLEQLRLILGCDSDAGIADRDARLGAAIHGCRCDRDPPAVGRELDCVRQEIEEHLSHAAAVRVHAQILRQRSHDKRMTVLLHLRMNAAGRFAE